MLGLVESDLGSAGQGDRRDRTPSGLFEGETSSALTLERRDFAPEVVTHQIELVSIALVTWMNGGFGRWQARDQPLVAGVDRRSPEHVAKKGAIGRNVRAEDNEVNAKDHASV